MDKNNKLSRCNICLTFFHYEKGLQKSKGQPVRKQLYNTVYQNHGRQDHDPNRKIVRSYRLATSWIVILIVAKNRWRAGIMRICRFRYLVSHICFCGSRFIKHAFWNLEP